MGSLQPVCQDVPAGATCTDTDDGAFYTYSGAVAVTVTASAAWSGGCSRQPQTALSAQPDRLSIRQSGSSGWTAIPITNGGASVSPGCFATFPAGTTTTFSFDIGVNVAWTDDPGALGDLVTFEVMTP